MVFLLVVVVVGLIFIASIRPQKSLLSDFELRRRCEAGNEEALLDWRRNYLSASMETLRRIIEAILFVAMVMVSVAAYGWLAGGLVAIGLAILYPRIAHIKAVRALPQRVYIRYELALLEVADGLRGFTRILNPEVGKEREDYLPASRHELEHMIENSSDLVSLGERKMLKGALSFEGKKVKDYMTPRSKMEAIGSHELLGPLVLDGLHQTGHSHFPVLDGDIDRIVGMLHLSSLITSSVKESPTVADVMNPQVFYIREDQLLGDALGVCIKNRQHLLVVITEFHETVGVITVEDVIEQLIGQKVDGQFDRYDDIKAVAEHSPPQDN